jgi:hypothetical protein
VGGFLKKGREKIMICDETDQQVPDGVDGCNQVLPGDEGRERVVLVGRNSNISAVGIANGVHYSGRSGPPLARLCPSSGIHLKLARTNTHNKQGERELILSVQTSGRRRQWPSS